MKKFILLFIIIHIFSYANYLISNSEIVLFYDTNHNKIEYVRGDVFHNFEISRIEPKLVINNSEILNLDNYVKSASLVEGTNILKVIYNIDGQDIQMSVIPSMIDKSQLIFDVNLGNYKNKENIDFVFQIVPQYDNRFAKYNKDEKTYIYDNFSFTSNYTGELFISRNGTLEDFTLEEVTELLKKYEEDNLYYIVRNVNGVKNLIFTIDFYNKDGINKKIDRDIEEKEYIYWEGLNSESKFLGQKGVVLEQLKNLEIISSRALIPDQISFNKSKEDLNNKIKLIYVNSIVDKNFDVNRFFQDINIKKKDSEAVVYYTLLFQYLNDSNNYIDPQLFDKKVSLEVLSLLDYLEEDNGSIVNVRDNIENYAWYFRLINNIKNRHEFASEKDFILKKEKLLKDYVLKNYVLKIGLKSQREDKSSSYKNIKYIDFLLKEKQIEILNRDYKKYYNRLYGVLVVKDGKEEKINLDYNLNFVIKLYQNGEYQLADKLFANIEKIVEENNQFLLPQIYINKENPAGIYGEMLYLYFLALKTKEQVKNGN